MSNQTETTKTPPETFTADKVLTICRANVGRSQAAMAIAQSIGLQAESAGTDVRFERGLTVGEWTDGVDDATNLITAMREIGLDIAGNRRRQLTESQLHNFGGVVVVLAEKTAWPDYLFEFEEENHDTGRFVDWAYMPDFKGQDLEETRAIRNMLMGNVLELAFDLRAVRRN